MAATATDTDTSSRTWFEREVLDLLPELHGTALRLTGARAEAEDLVAETVCRAWEKLDTLRDRGAFRRWLHRILGNTYVSHCRTCAARGEHESLDAGGEGERFSLFEQLHQPFLLWQANPERAFLNRMLREDLESAVDELPDAFRVVVVMADVQGFTYAEIAEELDVPMGTVKSRLARGRSLLQRALWTHADEG
jgi:RNA polymerase sigma-70 factor (ECF subfamily)